MGIAPNPLSKLQSTSMWKSKKAIWYVLLSVSMDVPDAEQVKNWIGVDRGQNQIP